METFIPMPQTSVRIGPTQPPNILQFRHFAHLGHGRSAYDGGMAQHAALTVRIATVSSSLNLVQRGPVDKK